MALWKAKIANGLRVGWVAATNAGAIRTGLVSANWIATLINKGHSASVVLTPVVESPEKPGAYYVDVPSVFLIANGAGHYMLMVELTANPKSVKNFTLEIVQQDLDDLGLLHHMGAVWIDPNNGTAGTTPGINGIQSNPVISLADATTIADAIGLREFRIVTGSFTLLRDYTEWKFCGLDQPEINLNGQNVNESKFENVKVKGAQIGAITAEQSALEDITNFLGIAHQSSLMGTITLATGKSTLHHCYSNVPGAGAPTVDFVGAGRSLNMRGYSGGIQVENMVDANNKCTIEFIAGQVILNGSCTDGELELRGIAKLTDNSAGTAVSTVALLPIAIPDFVWNAILTGLTYNIPTSAGRRLREVVDANVIESGKAQGGTSTTITLAASASALDGFYRHQVIVIVGGTGQGQARMVDSYDGTTKIADVTPDNEDPWVVAPDDTSEYEIRTNTAAHVLHVHAIAVNEIANGLLDLANAADGYTVREFLRLFGAAMGGESSGSAANAPVHRAVDDSKDRITAVTNDAGDRLTVSVDLSP